MGLDTNFPFGQNPRRVRFLNYFEKSFFQSSSYFLRSELANSSLLWTSSSMHVTNHRFLWSRTDNHLSSNNFPRGSYFYRRILWRREPLINSWNVGIHPPIDQADTRYWNSYAYYYCIPTLPQVNLLVVVYPSSRTSAAASEKSTPVNESTDSFCRDVGGATPE